MRNTNVKWKPPIYICCFSQWLCIYISDKIYATFHNLRSWCGVLRIIKLIQLAVRRHTNSGYDKKNQKLSFLLDFCLTQQPTAIRVNKPREFSNDLEGPLEFSLFIIYWKIREFLTWCDFTLGCEVNFEVYIYWTNQIIVDCFNSLSNVV